VKKLRAAVGGGSEIMDSFSEMSVSEMENGDEAGVRYVQLLPTRGGGIERDRSFHFYLCYRLVGDPKMSHSQFPTDQFPTDRLPQWNGMMDTCFFSQHVRLSRS
jgi:hypothetical protein